MRSIQPLQLKESVLQYVTTSAPLRVSFVGGGTDLPGFYEREEGAVVSTAINQSIFVTVKSMGSLYDYQYRLNYSITENVNSVDEIQNVIARECLKLVPVPPPLYISTVADIPASSGLGSSSCFAVALLKALHLMRGERASDVQIAEEAAYIEMVALQRPVGKQDHYAAAFGGLNVFHFQRSGNVMVEPLYLSSIGLQELFSHFLLFWTGIQRDAGVVLKEQKDNIQDKMKMLIEMRDQVYEMKALFQKDLIVEEMGIMLHQGWLRKRQLASTISNSQIDQWYEAAMNAGAYGGKLCGAGGGGFLLFLAPQSEHASIRSALQDLRELKFAFEPHGVRTIIQVPRDEQVLLGEL